MRRKLEAEYATVESDLLEKFPKVYIASHANDPSQQLVPFAHIDGYHLHRVLTSRWIVEKEGRCNVRA